MNWYKWTFEDGFVVFDSAIDPKRMTELISEHGKVRRKERA